MCSAVIASTQRQHSVNTRRSTTTPRNLKDISTDPTYEGCFREDPSHREFVVAGGNHDFNDVNPKLCKALCKSMDYPYAALQRGFMCLCGESTGAHSNGSQYGCNLRCAGNPTDLCGGLEYSSVYSTVTSVKGIAIVDSGYVEVFQETVIGTTLEAGSDSAVYRFDFGDDTGIANETVGPQPHVFSDVGVYLVQAWVENDASGPLEARKEVYVEAPISDLWAACHPFVEVGFPFECTGSAGQGNNMDVNWNFNDESEEVHMKVADAQRFSVGRPIPRRLVSIQPSLDLQGVFLIPALEFRQEAKLEAWEVFAVREGQVKLQVYRPLCGENEKYCAFNRTCLNRYYPCPPYTETPCLNHTAFCLEAGTCQPFQTTYYFAESNTTYTLAPCQNQTLVTANANRNETNGTNSSDIPVQMCNYSVPYVRVPEHTFGSCSYQDVQREMKLPYQVVGQTVVYLKEGYNIFTVNASERYSVRPRDWVGFGPYQQEFPDYYRKAAYPLIGEIAHYPTDNETAFFKEQGLLSSEREVRRGDVEMLEVAFYIRAHISKSTTSWVSHIFSNSGMFEINAKYNNRLGREVGAPPQWIASQYRILSIQGLHFTRDLGIYYACTDAAYTMHVEITQGTYVRFKWTFPDGSVNTSLPFLTNGVQDGPNVKTADSQGYLFAEIGNYTTHVKAYNNVSFVDIVLSTIARYRITGLNGTVELYPGDNTTKDWNLILSGCWFNYSSFILTGNVVQYRWNHGDGSTTGSWSFDTVHDHYYASPGVYSVYIEADNIASTLDHTFEVTAVKPNYVRAPAYTTSEVATLFFCAVTWHSGQGLTFSWDFGDGASTIIENTGYVWHNYSTFSTYQVQCVISNYPAVSDTTPIIVQDPVEGVVLHNKTEVLATGDTVDFTVSWSRGNDVHFDWYFGDSGQDSTTTPSVQYTYAKIGYYNVTVNVSNVVSWMISEAIIVELQERVTNVQVTASDNLILHPVEASVTTDTGNKIWYDYDFGDSFNAIRVPDTSCSHSYSLPDTFTVTVRAYNNVSDESATTSIQIDASISNAVLYLTSPHIRANVLEATCVANNGSSVTITFDWGDGTVSEPFVGIYDGEGSYYIGTHTYSTEGTFNITCYVENPWADAVGFHEVIVQEAIVALRFEPEVAVKGEIFEFIVAPFVGDSHDVLFYWDYDDEFKFRTDAFTHQYVFREAGLYQVTVRAENLVSEFSTTQDVYVQEHIEGLRLLAEVYPVMPSQPSIVAWEIEYGTEVLYTVDMGDGTEPQVFEQSSVGKMWSLDYTYTEPGSYLITVTASNKLNSLNVSTIAYIEYAIEGLRAYTRGNKTTHTDQSAYIIIEIERGTNVEYICDYHDGSPPIATTKQYCKHMFIDLGHHLVTVSASNHLSAASVQANDTYYVLLPPIPHEIKELAIGAPSATIRGQMTVFRLQRYRGNRFNCTWDFGDNSTILDLDQYFVYIPINHTYDRIGEYEIQLNCTNFFHPFVYASSKIVVQVPPRGLNLTSRRVGQYGKDLEVNITLEAGTDVAANVEFNEGRYSIIMQELDGYVAIPGEHVNVSGWLDVIITAENLVPPVLTLQDRIYVEAEISGLEVWAEKPYVAVGEVVTLHVSLATGTNVVLEWYFGTNYLLTSQINSTRTILTDTKQHFYPSLGLYAAFIIATNEIGTKTHTPVLIAVQEKVRGFSMTAITPVKYPDGQITFNIFWDTRIQKLPTNASITFESGEPMNLQSTVELGSLEIITWIQHNLTVGSDCNNPDEANINPLCNASFTSTYMTDAKVRIFTIVHAYTPGKYSAIVSVHNLASEQVFPKEVQTEEPIVNCSITVHNVDRLNVKFGTEGGGPEQNYFPVEFPVLFQARVSQGTAVMYLWRFGDGATSSSMDTEHQYENAGSFTVRLITMNIFGVEDSFETVHIQESVIGLFAAHTGPVARRRQITVIIFAAQPGTDAAYALQINNQSDSHLLDAPVNDAITIASALEIMNPSIFLPFDPFTHFITTYNLTFNLSGNYEVTVTGTNFASSLSITTILPVTEDSCQLPQVLIRGGSKNASEPWQVKRNRLITLVSEVKLDCSSTTRALFHWDTYIVSYFNNRPLPANQLFGYPLPETIKTTEADLVIPRRTLDYNTYLVQLTVTMNNNARVLNQNQTYLEVVPSDLVVSILGGSAVSISWNDTTISLDASMSFDPDDLYISENETTESSRLMFTWYCKLSDEVFSFEEGFVAPDPSASGCFGSGPDTSVAMGITSYNVLLETLIRSSQYVFAVVGSKEGRSSQYFLQTVTVVEGEPPKLKIRCVRNCGTKINPQKQLALAVECSNCGNQTDDLQYTWNVTGLEDGASESGFEITKDTVTGGNSPYLVIKSTIFLQHLSARFSVTISVLHSLSREAGYSEYHYESGGVPTQGVCSISPREGTALSTEFIITCTGFDSDEKPLHYEYLYSTGSEDTASVAGPETSNEMFTLLYYSPEGVTAPITLPMGIASRSYMVDVHVEVMDSLGASVHAQLQVKVLPPPESQLTAELSALRRGNASTLDLYLEKADTQSATKLINTLATILNEETVQPEDGGDSEDTGGDADWLMQKKELRSKLVEKLTQVSVLNLDSTKQTSAAITQAINKPNEVTPGTQMLAADSYLEMVDVLKEESREGTSIDVIEDASRYFYSGASSLLRAAATQVQSFYDLLDSHPDDWDAFWTAEGAALSNITYPESVALTLTTSSDAVVDLSVPDIDVIEQEPWVPFQLRESRNVTQKVFAIIEEVSNTILSSKVPGEQATVIQTGPMTLILRQENLREPGIRFFQTSDGTWFKIPGEAMEEIAGMYGQESISAQAVSMSENPYSWHLSASDIKTSVIGLSLKDDNGDELIVTDLSSNIEMLIPRGGDSTIRFESMTASSTERLYLHFNLTDTHSSLHIDIHLADKAGQDTPTDTPLEAVLRYGFYPTPDEYDLKMTLPIPDEDLYSSSYNTTWNITTNPYTWFIPENRLYAVGAYYLSVRPLSNPADPGSVSGGVNATGGTTTEEVKVDVNVQIYSARCMYWSPVYEQWFPHGCEVGSLTTASFTHCLCDHLSSFGGSFFVPPNRQIVVVEEEPEIAEVTRTFIVLYVLGGAVGAFLISLACAFKADWRFFKKLFSDLEMEQSCYIVTFFTGMDLSSGTTAKVCLCLHGTLATSEPMEMANQDNTSFKGSCVDSFLVTMPTDVGRVEGITVWHGGQGYSPQWHLSRVLVQSYVTGDKAYFLCNHVLKSANDPVFFKASTPKQLAKHHHLFMTTPSYRPLTKHISVWNMVSRPVISQVTHAQRVASFFCPLFLSMAVVTLVKGFLEPGQEEPSDGTISLSLDMTSIMAGVAAGVVVLLVYYLLVFLFNTIRPRLKVKKVDEAQVTEESSPNVAAKDVRRRTKGRQQKSPMQPEDIKVEVSETKDKRVQNLGALSIKNKRDQEEKKDTKQVTSALAASVDIPKVLSNSSWSEDWSDYSENFEDPSEDLPYNINQNAKRHSNEYLNEGESLEESINQNANPSTESSEDDSSPRPSNPMPLQLPCKNSRGHFRWSLSRHSHKASLKDTVGEPDAQDGVHRFDYGGGNGKHVMQDLNPNWNRNALTDEGLSELGGSKQHPGKSGRVSVLKERELPKSSQDKNVKGISQRQEKRCFSGCGERNILPWWTSIILWIVNWILIGGSAALTAFLTLDYTAQKAINWLLPVGIALAQNLLLLQPILAFLNAIFRSVFLKPDCLTQASISFESTTSSFQHKAPPDLDTEAKTETKSSRLLRNHRLRKLQTSIRPKARLLKGVKKHVPAWLFLVLVIYLAHGKRTIDEFQTTSTTKNMFVKGAEHGTPSFHQVHKADQFWQWARETLLPGLEPVMNAERNHEHLKLLGTPQLRQLRVNRTLADACRDTISGDVPLSSSTPCSSSYTSDIEDTAQYLSSWQPTDNDVSPALQPAGYRFYNQEELQNAPFTGKYATYHGGGYAAELAGGYAEAVQMIQTLEAEEWIDGYTRAIFVEFLLFNAQLNLTSVVRLVAEVLPTGYQEPVVLVGVVGVGGDSGWAGTVYIACIGLLGVAVYSMMFTEAHCMLRWGRTYYTSLRHLVGLLNFITAAVAVAILAYQWMVSGAATVTNPSFGAFIDSQSVTCYASLSSALVVFTAMMKVLFQLHCNERMALILQACEASFLQVLKSLPVFVATVMAFVFSGWALYSGHIKSFHSLPGSAVGLINFYLGGLSIEANQQKTLPVFLIMLVTFVGFIGLLTFTVVILQTYKSARFHKILSHFVHSGCLTRYVRTLKSRLLVQRTHRKMQVRRYVVLRQSRCLRNRQPVFVPTLAMTRIEERVERLLQKSEEDNEILFDDQRKLVRTVIREYALLKALKRTASVK
ncbi:polycystin-1-like [Patiria miniata]|uniref:Polycystin-1 n=1 Tax=Patiria miniata TaxID=46514 RepID=A0A914A4E2_PATMI|nr:polycystin-1-like [Patiria miniata]